MKIRWVIWRTRFLEKIRGKHGVLPEETEHVLRREPHFRKAQKGRVPGEDVYAAYGRSAAGRYLIVLFIFKKPDGAMPISARDMTRSERRYYEKNKQKA